MQIKLINLSEPLAGNRQGAAGRLFGVPLIVTMTLTPDVIQHCSMPGHTVDCGAEVLLGVGVTRSINLQMRLALQDPSLPSPHVLGGGVAG